MIISRGPVHFFRCNTGSSSCGHHHQYNRCIVFHNSGVWFPDTDTASASAPGGGGRSSTGSNSPKDEFIMPFLSYKEASGSGSGFMQAKRSISMLLERPSTQCTSTGGSWTIRSWAGQCLADRSRRLLWWSNRCISTGVCN